MEEIGVMKIGMREVGGGDVGKEWSGRERGRGDSRTNR